MQTFISEPLFHGLGYKNQRSASRVSRLEVRKELKYKADIEKCFFLINSLINTLLIIPIFVLMLYNTPKPNLEIASAMARPRCNLEVDEDIKKQTNKQTIAASVVWSVTGHKGVQFTNY